MAAGTTPETSTPARVPALRWFGRLRLLRLLGKSESTTAWRVADPRSGQEMMLVLPRRQPVGPAAQASWLDAVSRAARLNHPQIATAVETAVQDGWPYALYDPRDDATLSDRLGSKGLPGSEAAALSMQLVQGLAFAHEAGLTHEDLQPWLVLVADSGALRLTGLGVATAGALTASPAAAAAADASHGAAERQNQRAAAERDVLMSGALLHWLLTGQAPLDETDLGRAVARLPPQGREVMRLPFATAHPVADALRAIANRATDRQPRQRYRNARTLQQALEGWSASDGGVAQGTLAQLADRIRHAGVLPAAPGTAERMTRLAVLASHHTDTLTRVVLEDPALCFELLRLVNVAHGSGSRMGAGEPVLTVRRAVAMLGLEGVRRGALSLREWPGAVGGADGQPADALQRRLGHGGRAARLAQALRPAGYDAEVVHIVTLMQNLGRLLVHYHFADAAQQIQRLMQPAAPARTGEPEEPGMSEEGAAYAVLGVDTETLATAVARHWGLDEAALAMIRRPPLATAVHSSGSDYDTLRVLAGCANEAMDAVALPAGRSGPALLRVLQRYGRLLDIAAKDLQDGLALALSGVAPEAGHSELAAFKP